MNSELAATYDATVAKIMEIPKFAAKTGHGNLRYYLEKLSHPEAKLKTVHVAGTNGKGSVCRALESMGQAAGLRVGVFTSPHLVRVNERFVLDGREISDEAFVATEAEVARVVAEGIQAGHAHPSFFEYLFLMACVWFAKEAPDLVIFETGLGGRLDATNVLNPTLTIITSIGMDHMQYLGDTIEQIAGEKAGIIKPKTPCVFADEEEAVSRVIREKAKEMEAPVYPVVVSEICTLEETAAELRFSYENEFDARLHHGDCTYSLHHAASYQKTNTLLAAVGAYLLWEHEMADVGDIIRRGLEHFSMPGRMEEIAPEVFVDGAHNAPGMKAFCDTRRMMYNDKDVVLLFAAASDKAYETMIPMLTDSMQTRLRLVVLTEAAGERSALTENLKESFRKAGFEGEILEEKNPAEAYHKAVAARKEEERVFCVGSLYLVGAVKSALEAERIHSFA